MELTAQQVNALSAATTPEDAYRVFASSVTDGLAKLLADSIAKAVGSASVSAQNTSSIQGWEQFVSGLVVRLDWGSPGFSTAPSIKNSFASSPIQSPAGTVGALGGIGFTVGITGSF